MLKILKEYKIVCFLGTWIWMLLKLINFFFLVSMQRIYKYLRRKMITYVLNQWKAKWKAKWKAIFLYSQKNIKNSLITY